MRRLIVRVAALPTCDGSQRKRGGQAATLPETKPDDSLTDHCEPTATGISHSEIKDHQAVDGEVAGKQGMEEKQQAQEPVEVPMHQQEEHANPSPANFSDAAADPEDTFAADESQSSPSMVSQLGIKPNATSQVQTSIQQNAQATQHITGVTSARDRQREQLQLLLNVKASVQTLCKALQFGCSLPQNADRVTAGVSYVVPSKLALPHVTIRPPSPEAAAGPTVHCLVSVLQNEATLGVVMPAVCEGFIKDYLLHPERRAGLAAQSSMPFRRIKGIAELKPLLVDRTFTCLHYHLSDDFQLTPCTLAPPAVSVPQTAPLSQAHCQGHLQPLTALDPASHQASANGNDHSARWSLADSNVQVGLLVRKGIGGTSPARAAARRLHRQGALGNLLANTQSQVPSGHPMLPATAPNPARQGNERGNIATDMPRDVQGGAVAAETMIDPCNGEADDLMESSPERAQEAAGEHLVADPHIAGLSAAVSSEQRVRLYTQSCRLELYCAQTTWTALSREQQAALVGAIQGLERQLSSLFAQWNHEALNSYAERLAVSVDCALLQQQRAPTPAAVTAPAAFNSPSAGTCSLPAVLTSAASANLIGGAGVSVHATAPQPLLPLQLPQPAASTLADRAALSNGQHAAVQQPFNMEHHARSGAQPAALPLRETAAGEAVSAGAGVQHHGSVQQSQSPLLPRPSTPSALEAQRTVASPGSGIVMGVPCSLPSPLPSQPQAPVSWPSPAAALGFLHQLFRGVTPSQPPGSHLKPPAATGVNISRGNTTDRVSAASDGGQAGHSIAGTLRHAGCSPQSPVGAQPLPTMQSPQSVPVLAARSEGLSASPQIEGASEGCMPCCGPSTPSKAPQSPSCTHESGQAAQHSATPPARPSMAALPAPQPAATPTASSGFPVLLASSPPSTPTGFPQPMSSVTAPAGQDLKLPVVGTIEASLAGALAAADPASALVIASASSSALAALGFSSSAGPVPWPLYLIGTRDSFKFDMHAERKEVEFNGRKCVKTEYFFHPSQIPENYHEVVGRRQSLATPAKAPEHGNQDGQQKEEVNHSPVEPAQAMEAQQEPLPCCASDGSIGRSEEHLQFVAANQVMGSREPLPNITGTPEPESVLAGCAQPLPAALLPAGICTYNNFYTAEELRQMEGCADGVHEKAREGRLPPTCFHETRGRGGALKRTKFFFGARYLWTAEQTSDVASRQAGGVRLDVPHAPKWMQALAEKPLVDSGLVPEKFFDAWALNMYHDGSEGIQSHFDDGTRFSRPIFSVRLFSDSRLSFGTQLYGYSNGAFTVDMPRGCITVMEAGGYAVEGVKHCVRPADLGGKSAALIMRHINGPCMQQARELFEAQTLKMLRAWSMKDAPVPPLASPEQSRDNLSAAMIERECWNMLDSCIQRLESPLWQTASAPGLEVAHVLDSIICKVERLHYMERHGSDRRAFTSHVQAGGTGTKRKVPLARMVFSNVKRLKWIEQRLSCASTPQSSHMAGSAGLGPAPASCAQPIPLPSPVLQSPPQPAAEPQKSLNTARAVPQPALQQASMHHVDTSAQRTDPPNAAAASPASPQPCVGGVASTIVHVTSLGEGDVEQVLRGLLLAASEEDVGQSIAHMAASERQRLLHYLQHTLRRLPSAAAQPDTYGDAYAPPQTANKPQLADGTIPVQTGPPVVLPRNPAVGASQGAVQLKGHPGAVCAACEQPLSVGQSVWACTGQCCQFFHSACAAPAATQKCSQCTSDRRICFHCKASGLLGELLKCSMGRCGHFYHRSCAAACPLTNWGAASGNFRCPAHYCARCGLSGPMRPSQLQASPFSSAGRAGSFKQSFQAPKSVAKHLLHCRKWSLRPSAPRAAESAASTVVDEQSLNERRSSAAQAASTPDSTHHKEVRGATETARATYNIVFVTAEVAPWSKTGGLGDVCGSLPPALAARGHRVMVVSPRYANYDDIPESKGPQMRVSVLDTEVGLYHHRSKGVDWVFVDHPSYPRPGGLYADAFGVYGDNQYRYTLLCLAGLEAPLQLQIEGSTYGDDCIFIANDWHAAMVPVYLAAKYRPGGVYGSARSVLAIHNLRHQGVFPPKTFAMYGLPGHWYGALEWQYPPHQRQGSYEEEGRAVNTMKGGISTADRIVTVSPGYAWEIQTPEGGWGMEQMLGSRAYALNGVLNGIDNHDWNPQHDKHLAHKYSVSNFSRGKAANKAALQKELSLPERPEVPLIGFIGRLDYQKGADLVLGAVPWLMEQDVQLVCLGTGDVSLEAGMRWMENTYPDRARGWVGFNVPMSHKITAAADILLMPSRFEPCGLNQLYAMAYGTVPVAHATGGLRDTVIPFNPWDGTGTGALQQRGMERNSTWDKAAAEYETIFGWAKIDQPYCK
ncbi:g10373 [Coccomyxa elongata]